MAGTWSYNAWIKYEAVGASATAGTDFYAVSGDLCHHGSQSRLEEYCEGGGQPTPENVAVMHYADEATEGNETYRFHAWVHRYETGNVDADGVPIWSAPCTSKACGRATATGTILDVVEEPLPPSGRATLSKGVSVEEGKTAELTLTFTPYSAEAHGPGSLSYATFDGDALAGRDYTAVSGTMEIPACSASCGALTKTIQIRTTADQVAEVDEYFHVEVTNSDSAADIRDDLVIVTIADNEPNVPPEVGIGSVPREVPYIEGGDEHWHVDLSAGASDQDGQIVRYRWTGGGGFSSRTVARPTWNAPRSETGGTYVLTVRVWDNDGATAEDSVTIRVAPTPREEDDEPPPDEEEVVENVHPDVTLTASDNSLTRDEDRVITLTAVATDDDGTIESYEWSEDVTETPTIGVVEWTAPRPDSDTRYPISVTVTDDDGARSSDSTRIWVQGPRRDTQPTPTVEIRKVGSRTEPAPSEADVGESVVMAALGSVYFLVGGERATWSWSADRGTLGTPGECTLDRSFCSEVTWTAPDVATATDVATITATITYREKSGSNTHRISINTTDPNVAPTATITLTDDTVDAEQLDEGQAVALQVTATDEDGTIDADSYVWSASGGTLSSTSGTTTTWTAPSVRERRSYTVRVQVEDDEDAEGTGTITLHVNNSVPNVAPTVSIDDVETDVNGGKRVALSATASDSDGRITSYNWHGPRTETFSAPTQRTTIWTAPYTDDEETYEITVVVQDDEGLSVRSAPKTFTVAANKAPTVEVTAADTSIAAGTTATLTATATDEDGEINNGTWRWSEAEDRGEFTSVSQGSASWLAPWNEQETVYTFEASVADNNGRRAAGTVDVTVAAHVNVPPAVELESSDGDGRIDAGETIRLTATATDNDGTVESYEWDDVGGRIENSSVPSRAYWTAPEPDTETVYTPSVTVTDDRGGSTTKSVSITVAAAEEVTENPYPVVYMELDRGSNDDRVDEGESFTVNIRLSKTGPSGAKLNYQIGEEDERAGGGDCRDYVHRKGTLNLAGKKSTTLTVNVLADTCQNEGKETIGVHFNEPVKVRPSVNYVSALVFNSATTFYFKNEHFNDLGETVNHTVAEGSRARVTVKRDIGHPGLRVPAWAELSVRPRGGATTGEDYEDPGLVRVEFTANQTEAAVYIQTLRDDIDGEVNEGVILEIERTEGAHGAGAERSVYIQDPHPTPREIQVSVRALTPQVREGEIARCEVSVREVQGRPLDRGLRVKFWTHNWDSSTAAEPGVDFTANDGTWLTFGRSGDQKQRVQIQTLATQANRGEKRFACRIGEDIEGPDYEYAGGYILTRGERNVNVAISNRNVTNQPADTTRGPVWAHDVETRERTVRVDLHLNGDLPEVNHGKVPLVVTWTTATDGDSTADSDDFTAVSGTHTFRPNGGTSFSVTIPIACDALAENDEHFYLRATGAREDETVVGGGSAVKITIRTDANECGGVPATLSVDDAVAKEGDILKFKVRVTNRRFNEHIIINYTTADGTATAGSDYTERKGSTTIFRNNTTATVFIYTLRDEVRDEGETVRLILRTLR